MIMAKALFWGLIGWFLLVAIITAFMAAASIADRDEYHEDKKNDNYSEGE